MLTHDLHRVMRFDCNKIFTAIFFLHDKTVSFTGQFSWATKPKQLAENANTLYSEASACSILLPLSVLEFDTNTQQMSVVIKLIHLMIESEYH